MRITSRHINGVVVLTLHGPLKNELDQVTNRVHLDLDLGRKNFLLDMQDCCEVTERELKGLVGLNVSVLRLQGGMKLLHLETDAAEYASEAMLPLDCFENFDVALNSFCGFLSKRKLNDLHLLTVPQFETEGWAKGLSDEIAVLCQTRRTKVLLDLLYLERCYWPTAGFFVQLMRLQYIDTIKPNIKLVNTRPQTRQCLRSSCIDQSFIFFDNLHEAIASYGPDYQTHAALFDPAALSATTNGVIT